jgi:hypothetical protein
MSPIVATILGLIAAAPGAISQIESLWTLVKGAFSATDVATVDAVLAVLNPKVDADVAALHIAALAGMGAAAA